MAGNFPCWYRVISTRLLANQRSEFTNGIIHMQVYKKWETTFEINVFIKLHEIFTWNIYCTFSHYFTCIFISSIASPPQKSASFNPFFDASFQHHWIISRLHPDTLSTLFLCRLILNNITEIRLTMKSDSITIVKFVYIRRAALFSVLVWYHIPNCPVAW